MVVHSHDCFIYHNYLHHDVTILGIWTNFQKIGGTQCFKNCNESTIDITFHSRYN